RAGPRVVEAHTRELERRRHHLVPERPHVRRRVERDLGRGVPTDKVVDRELLERIDYGATHPVPRGLGILREGLRRKAIEVEPCFPDAVEPTLLDDVDPPRAPTAKEPCDVSLSRPRSSPERAPRAITREPVEGQMPSVDRPDERLVGGRGPRAMRGKPRERRILAHMPERMRTFARIRWRRSSHYRNSRKTKDLGAFASGSLDPGPDLFS